MGFKAWRETREFRFSALFQFKVPVFHVSRLGASPGFSDESVASAKTAHPKIKLEQCTSFQRRRSFSECPSPQFQLRVRRLVSRTGQGSGLRRLPLAFQ